MQITEKKIKVSELFKNYSNKGDDGVMAYDNKLTVRPSYQREFIYNEKQQVAVIKSIMNNLPLSVMYWAKTGEDTYEILDGQQRTMSICEYLSGNYSIGEIYYHNIPAGALKDTIDNYELLIYVCEGTEQEKLDWFRTINIAGEVLTDQELLNAVYHGTWLTDAKKYFSKPSCVAIENGYIKGSPIRQDLLETALSWIAERDGFDSGAEYMAKHQHDSDASVLWLYYDSVMKWAKGLFSPRAKITDNQNWGILYNHYNTKAYDKAKLEEDIVKYIADDDVTNQKGIIEYLLSNKDPKKERCLSIRAFTPNQKRKKFEEQKGVCPDCGKTFKFEEMDGDHEIPWSKGGHTTLDNLIMRCSSCNKSKGSKTV